jgi:hypothetical protein
VTFTNSAWLLGRTLTDSTSQPVLLDFCDLHNCPVSNSAVFLLMFAFPSSLPFALCLLLFKLHQTSLSDSFQILAHS